MGLLDQWLNEAQAYGEAVKDRVNHLQGFPSRFMKAPEVADNIAEQRFPGYDRDGSTKNAFRHALGTGMISQELADAMGGSVPAKHLGAALAKIAGYGWEAPSWGGSKNGKQTLDSLHDLNANAVGASESIYANNQAELIRNLEALARSSKQEFPPTVLQPSPGYLTRTHR